VRTLLGARENEELWPIGSSSREKRALIIQDLPKRRDRGWRRVRIFGSACAREEAEYRCNVSKLAGAMRKAGSIVIHVHYIVEPGAPGLKLNAPLFRGIAESKAVVRGTWGAKAVAGLEPQAGDIVIEKMRMNAFHGTKLETILQGYGIDSLVITGAWTNFSIEPHRPARRRCGL